MALRPRLRPVRGYQLGNGRRQLRRGELRIRLLTTSITTTIASVATTTTTTTIATTIATTITIATVTTITNPPFNSSF